MKPLKYDANGLLTAVVQDIYTGQVLMVAMMNSKAVGLTLSTNKAHFWSRSRKKLWLKGETSGNILDVLEVKVDCDRDALLLLVSPRGPACHTGNTSCFFSDVEESNDLVTTQPEGIGGVVLGSFAPQNHTPAHPYPGKLSSNMINKLFHIVKDRKTNPVSGSYTNALLDSGHERIAQKVGEEAVELIIASSTQGKQRVIEESSDLIYHLIVLLAHQGISLADIERELEKRHSEKGN